jgi:DNA-binding transcriptional MerR regulator
MFAGRLSIGELSKQSGVKVVTIRYYEQISLLPAPPRAENNYRLYRREHLERLKFIRRCRALGFTIVQVRDLIRVSSQTGSNCNAIDRLTESHLEKIEQKIAELETLASQLRSIQKACRGNGRIADCRILRAISS